MFMLSHLFSTFLYNTRHSNSFTSSWEEDGSWDLIDSYDRGQTTHAQRRTVSFQRYHRVFGYVKKIYQIVMREV